MSVGRAVGRSAAVGCGCDMNSVHRTVRRTALWFFAGLRSQRSVCALLLSVL